MKDMQRRRMKWKRQVMRRDEEHVGREIMDMEVQGRRRRGRPKEKRVECFKEEEEED